MRRLTAKIKRQFITGLTILLPVGLTFYIIIALFKILSKILYPVFERIHYFEVFPKEALYIFSFIGVVMVIWVIGVLASNFIGRKLLKYFKRLMVKTPIINSIYKTIEQIIEALLLEKKAFKEVVLIEYPRKGVNTLAFLTGELEVDDKKYLTLFVPTTPNPTSGFFIMVEENDVKRLNIPIEDATKLIVSGGIITPKKWKRRRND
ncbi:MAG: DUF502 domain-containing protein [Caldiserica bacterium]|nr:MAG: DUF502 domain-containing protein [Caldisericota bacterium]